ncbi:MAG: glutamate--cysteine ligase [Deltaproteobacteria bacterium]|nr:glutamate--cysteine ligase [Deltaproteobacteria bacterium]
MVEEDASSPLVQSVDDLESYFHAGSKNRDAWRVGVEYEKPVVDATTGESARYDGPRGIRRLLEEMLARSQHWEGVYEGESLIALKDGLASITLEPGGQFEMSGQQCESLHCVNDELQRHVDEILEVGELLGLRFLGLGIAPKTPLSRTPWMPKRRYQIMRRIMSRTGQLGTRMMGQTATVQCNFDYADERDATAKMRVGMSMGPVLVAISANSPVVDGALTGYQSFRSHIWTDTDAARCGFLPFVYSSDSLFRSYTEYALDVPMYFLARRGELLEVGGATFREFLATGFEGERATLADWTLHLTTLFPEVRLKSYLEIRSPDSQPVDLMLATPALMKGIFYDADCLAAAWDAIRKWSPRELSSLQEEAARHGLAAKWQRHTLKDYARELVEIGRVGLTRQRVEDSHGNDETVYLERMEEDLRGGRNPASRIIENWQGEWNGQIDRLIEAAAYRR